ADRINAGGGADHITGGRGDDVLRGGGGADVFVFSRAHGEDKIRDFRPELDQIDLSALRVTYEALDISRAGRLTVVDTGAGEIRLSGLHPDQIDADDFLF
ncbi:M10 family metallopeptidase C-terminal domain-containing protein, partial [Tritonibacter horizontis]|uniref:M10 family metallopeptidase C-terminal domain-containing protein n=1 Tax=Tritonibacter horizontis TaxID=1768241 RepID=UPI001A972858